MLINSIRFRPLSLKLNKRLFSSQISKTNDILNKSEKSEHFDKLEENSNKSLSEKQNKQMEILSKTQYMDRIWELNQTYSHKKEYNKITDPYIEGHKGYREMRETITSPKSFVLNRFRVLYRDWIHYREENQQKYVAKRHAKLGPDLSVANFVVVRGGRVIFKHAPNVWATHLDHFPDKYDPRYLLTAVDASNTKFRFEGIDNFQELNYLELLDLSNNKLDDWCCDKIARIFRNSNLCSLDLSNNPLISHRGIETLHRIRSLKTLKINGTDASKYPFLELLILSFNDLVPDCHIVSN